MAPRTNLLRRRSTLTPRPMSIQTGSVAFLGVQVGTMMDKTLKKEMVHQDPQPETTIHRYRQRGLDILHSKYALAIVVILCILDTVMVIGGLIIELNVLRLIQTELTNDNDNCTTRREIGDIIHDSYYWYTMNKVAHYFHYTSIAILSILLIETILKVIFLGTAIFSKKIELFDALVVTVSFALDIVYVKGTVLDSTSDTADSLSIMLPWRIVRVVNSLIVALLMHEHIKLVLMYKSKMYINNQLEEINQDFDTLQRQLIAVKKLAVTEGVKEWKINNVVGEVFRHSKERRNALNTMVSTVMSAAVGNNQALRAMKGRRKSFINSFKSRFGSRKRSTTKISKQINGNNSNNNLKLPYNTQTVVSLVDENGLMKTDGRKRSLNELILHSAEKVRFQDQRQHRSFHGSPSKELDHLYIQNMTKVTDSIDKTDDLNTNTRKKSCTSLTCITEETMTANGIEAVDKNTHKDEITETNDLQVSDISHVTPENHGGICNKAFENDDETQQKRPSHEKTCNEHILPTNTEIKNTDTKLSEETDTDTDTTQTLGNSPSTKHSMSNSEQAITRL